MTAALKAADLTLSRFLNLIEELDPPAAGAAARRIWLEAADGWAFDWWRGIEHGFHWCGAGREPCEPSEVDAAGCLSRSTAGRLFAPDGELRWRVVPALNERCWRTVFLGAGDWVGAGLEDRSDQLRGLQPRRERYFLWGQQTGQTPGEWIELRIPHRFRYPVAGNPRHVVAVVEHWRDEFGEPHFFRLCDLEPVEGTPDA